MQISSFQKAFRSIDDFYIVTIIDNNFAELAGVMLRSLVVNGEVEQAKITVICDGVTEKSKNNIASCLSPYEFQFIDLKAEIIAKIDNFPTNSNWSRTIYARLLLPDLLGVASGRILYLDADIVVLNSLLPLVTIDMQGFPLAARGGLEPKVSTRLNLAADTRTLNSGVLLIDVETWKRKNLSHKCMVVIRERSDLLRFFDQDALNIATEGNFLILDTKWNDYGKGDLTGVAILHFIHAKPNSIRCRHPAQSVYLHYRQLTPWANKPLQSIWHKRFRRIKHSVLSRLKLFRS